MIRKQILKVICVSGHLLPKLQEHAQNIEIIMNLILFKVISNWSNFWHVEFEIADVEFKMKV